jgi:SAM-dependent methyltransferase
MLAPVTEFFPAPPASVLEIGAGPGRDAKWFEARGYQVTAVEPVAEFREAGRRATGPDVRWIDDRLPRLAQLDTAGQAFDLVYVMAVWQHVPPSDRSVAMDRLCGLLAPGGTLVMTLRFGPGAPGRHAFEIDLEETRRHAGHAGVGIVHDVVATSVQSHKGDPKVQWRWLILRNPA